MKGSSQVSKLTCRRTSLDYFARRALAQPEAAGDINAIFYGHAHRFIYSEAALRKALEQAGFVNIMASAYRDPKSRYGHFDSHPARFAFAPPEWSQYWEAEKPPGPCRPRDYPASSAAQNSVS